MGYKVILVSLIFITSFIQSDSYSSYEDWKKAKEEAIMELNLTDGGAQKVEEMNKKENQWIPTLKERARKVELEFYVVLSKWTLKTVINKMRNLLVSQLSSPPSPSLYTVQYLNYFNNEIDTKNIVRVDQYLRRFFLRYVNRRQMIWRRKELMKIISVPKEVSALSGSFSEEDYYPDLDTDLDTVPSRTRKYEKTFLKEVNKKEIVSRETWNETIKNEMNDMESALEKKDLSGCGVFMYVRHSDDKEGFNEIDWRAYNFLITGIILLNNELLKEMVELHRVIESDCKGYTYIGCLEYFIGVRWERSPLKGKIFNYVLNNIEHIPLFHEYTQNGSYTLEEKKDVAIKRLERLIPSNITIWPGPTKDVHERIIKLADSTPDVKSHKFFIRWFEIWNDHMYDVFANGGYTYDSLKPKKERDPKKGSSARRINKIFR